MRVRDVMSTAPVTIDARASVADAMRTMLERKLSGLPVLDADGCLVGMVTEGDFLQRTETDTAPARPHWLALLLSPGKRAEEYVHSHGRTVSEVMSSGVIAVDANAPLAEGVALMQRHRIKRLPVLDGGRLVGVLSRADLMRASLQAVPPEDVAPAGDAQLAAAIERRMRAQDWCPRENVHIRVANGQVELLGVVTDERTRDGLRVLVENTVGVRSVIDRLATVEPLTGAVLRASGD